MAFPKLKPIRLHDYKKSKVVINWMKRKVPELHKESAQLRKGQERTKRINNVIA